MKVVIDDLKEKAKHWNKRTAQLIGKGKFSLAESASRLHIKYLQATQIIEENYKPVTKIEYVKKNN